MCRGRNWALTGRGCRGAPHQPGLLGRRGRTRSCRSGCSTQPGPAGHKAHKSPGDTPAANPASLSAAPREPHRAGVNAILQTPPAHLLSLILGCSCGHCCLQPRQALGCSSRRRRRRRLFSPVTVLALLQLSECPATLKASSTVAFYPLESNYPPSLHPGTLLRCKTTQLFHA